MSNYSLNESRLILGITVFSICAIDQRIALHWNLEHHWLNKLDLTVLAEKSGECCLAKLLQLLLREASFWVGSVLVPEPVTLF